MVDFNKLDRTIHEKGRLAIMTLLATRPRWPFQELKSALQMSDGNLVIHQAGYVAVTKEVVDRPLTSYSMTDRGRSAFKLYIETLEEIVKLGRG
jgi:DNA-binding HxlR family transcriptional regulator